jgi:hypothetical protein
VTGGASGGWASGTDGAWAGNGGEVRARWQAWPGGPGGGVGRGGGRVTTVA